MNGRLLAFVLLSALFATRADAQQIKLKVNLQVAASNPHYGVSLARFKEEVERRSEHAVVIEIFENAALYHDEEVVSALASGAIDIGIAPAHNFALKVPAVAVLDQPFLFNTRDLMRAAASPGSAVRQLIDGAILAEIGVRVLWWQSLGDNVFFAKGRDVADPEQVKDLTVATTGRTVAEFVGWCGANPTLVPLDSLRQAFRTGLLDVALVTLEEIEGQQLWSVADTITRTAHAPIELILGINERTWASLSPAHRDLIAEVAEVVERETRQRALALEQRAYRLASLKGIKTKELTPDQVADWRACSAEMLADYMEKNGELAQRLMAAYRTLRSDPCCVAAPGGVGDFTRR
jgi:TRAP-type C4-dicarboxylate transport system substrate-binding protein